ncbi:MAG: aminoacyl-histidine dipeptidase [Prevotellaceae bacterium]|nr:aminoacyl-histidine dipeptidase [Prevotellaceae bacterium]
MNKMDLNPKCVFDCFAQVNKIPRPSKKEGKMIDFLVNYGKGLGLETHRDEAGNVVIRKPATPGMEGRKTVILQSHIDMVCEKNASVEFDFERDAIQTVVEGEWMRAQGTTLGADDGIGVAMEMAILASTDIVHGPLECVFTRDEETGLTGAAGMKPGFMNGDWLINLDSEDEGQIFVSCAGGCRTNAVFHYTVEPLPEGMFCLSLHIKGLTGGHSGGDIEKKRANANKLLARFLYLGMRQLGLRLVDIQAGGLHNAIPREAAAVVAVREADKEALRALWNVFAAQVAEEYVVTEPSMEFIMQSAGAARAAVDQSTGDRLISALQGVYNGVLSFSQSLDLVETSTNLASIRLNAQEHTIVIVTSQRSSLQSARDNMSNTVSAVFQLAGAEVETTEGYPGWKMNPDSQLLSLTVEQYRRLFGKDPIVLGIHAGLECGLFSEKYPNLDMVSFGPTLVGVHSPDEKLLIPTVDMVWRHLLAILENVPE